MDLNSVQAGGKCVVTSADSEQQLDNSAEWDEFAESFREAALVILDATHALAACDGLETEV